MLKISRQAVYQYRRRYRALKSQEERLLPRIHTIRALMPRTGGRKLLQHLADVNIGRDKFFDILRKQGLLVKPRRRYALTTNSRHDLPVYPNLLVSQTATASNTIWVADQTYIRLRQGFCYLSLVTDLYSRKIVGYDIHPTLETSGPLKALTMALSRIAEPKNLIHHSDRGTQYCSHQYTAFLRERNIRISMTDPRSPHQNAVAERVNGILKTELYLDATFHSIQNTKQTISQAIYIYNNYRLHLSLGMTTPEMRYAA